MGLNPILLLEEPPISDNYIVNIIRPGEKEEEDNQDITSVQNKIPLVQDSINTESKKLIKEDKHNLELDETRNNLINSDKTLINEKHELDTPETKEVDEDPRRKRRRSSASS